LKGNSRAIEIAPDPFSLNILLEMKQEILRDALNRPFHIHINGYRCFIAGTILEKQNETNNGRSCPFDPLKK